MPTHEFQNIINQSTENFRIAGMVISLIGGAGTIMFGFILYKEL